MNRLRDWLNAQPDWVPPTFFTGILYVVGFLAAVVTGVMTGDWIWTLCVLGAGAGAGILIGFVVLFLEWLMS